jgi:hypothetical protein
LNHESALLRELNPNGSRWRVLHQDYQTTVELVGTDTSVIVMLRLSPSNTIEVTTCGPCWQPINAPSSGTVTMVDTERRGQPVATHGGSMRPIRQLNGDFTSIK